MSTFNYRTLRLSLTDRCSYRCRYCLPEKHPVFAPPGSLLGFEERLRALRILKRLGLRSVRLTGGEPLLVPDLEDVIRGIRALGFEEVALTTNGDRLAERAAALAGAGLDRVNVHLDSLRHGDFQWITQTKNRLSRVLDGIQEAKRAGLNPVKLNVVLLRGRREVVWELLNYAAEQALEVRFIELMPTGVAPDFFREHFLPAEEVFRDLSARFGFSPLPSAEGAGPARRFRIPALGVTVGFIGASCRDFCSSCMRLRLTSRGVLKRCLFEAGGFPLRDLLAEVPDDEEAAGRLWAWLSAKRSFNPYGDPAAVVRAFSLSEVGG